MVRNLESVMMSNRGIKTSVACVTDKATVAISREKKLGLPRDKISRSAICNPQCIWCKEVLHYKITILNFGILL